MKPELTKFHELVINHFAFLVDRYNFFIELPTGSSVKFTSSEMVIYLSEGKSEHDGILLPANEKPVNGLNIAYLAEYFGEPISPSFYPQVQDYAVLFTKYERQIIDHIQEWWLPANKFLLNKLIEKYGIEEMRGTLAEYIASKEGKEFKRQRRPLWR